MGKSIILILVGLAIVVGIQDFLNKKAKATQPTPRPYVILLSLDSFRWDYQDKAPTPTLDSISEYGVHALKLQPSFPSLSLPNNYTIATGLHPGNHGIIANSFYSNKLKQYFSEEDSHSIKNSGFYSGEPIWVTAEAQNIKTGSCSWIGSKAKIKGYYPTYNSHTNSAKQEADTIVSWLQKPYKQRPKLITWSINELAKITANYGTNSKETNGTISLIDNKIGNFLKAINTLDIRDSINLIIVSNHGVADINKTIDISQNISKNWVDTVVENSALLLIYPHKKYTNSVLTTLNATKGIKAWHKDDIPAKFSIKQNPRTPNIIAVADSDYNITFYPTLDKIKKATCGYENTQSNMNGVFYAIGPNFKKSYNTQQLYSVDIYNLVANILEIKPALNNGETERISHVLRD